MAPLKLIYFDIPGKAEAIRLCASVGKVDFEDVRISRERFAEMKEQGALPYGQVPALDVGAGRMLAQSSAILRYVATLGGLHPSDPLEAARIDSIISEEEDFFSGITISRYSARFGYGHMSEEFRAEVRKNLNDEVLPKHLRFLEGLLGDSKTGWLAGTEKPSAADFAFVPRLRWLVSGANDGIDGNLLDGYPKVKDLIAKMMAPARGCRVVRKEPAPAVGKIKISRITSITIISLRDQSITLRPSPSPTLPFGSCGSRTSCPLPPLRPSWWWC